MVGTALESKITNEHQLIFKWQFVAVNYCNESSNNNNNLFKYLQMPALKIQSHFKLFRNKIALPHF